IRNIINNAIKYTDYNGRITINAVPNGDKTMVRISDTGIGIPPGKMKDLFTLNATGGGTGTAGEKGIGLGLVIAKELIVLNQGKIWVESTPNQGSTFYIEVPSATESDVMAERE